MGRNCTNSTCHRESLAYTAAKYNDQNSIEILRDFWREEVVSPIDNRGDTILHFIAVHGNVKALEFLIKERPLSCRDLRIKNRNGDTAMHEAARFGRLEIVKMLVSLEREIVLEKNNKGETPLYVAAAYGEKNVFDFLADNNFDEFTMTRDDGSTILHAAVKQESYYFALQLLETYQELAKKHDKKGWSALNILATKHMSFRSGSIYTIQQMGTTPFLPMQCLEAFMYICIPTIYEESKSNCNLEDPQSTKDILIKRKRWSFVESLLDNAWLGVIDDEKQKHILALALAKKLIKEEDWSFYANSVENPLIQATKLGINELVVEIIQNFPQTIETIDEEDGKNILHIVAEKKHIYLFDYFTKNVSHVDRLFADIDQHGKTIIHYAASIGSPFKFSTAESSIKTTRGYKTLILMAWGVLWFKRVKYCVHPRLWAVKDNEGKTARELFDENHSNICKEAEKSIKDLAGAALILSTLLCTVNFAAVFTVPGGFDQESGIPVILNKKETHSDLWMLMFFLGAALYDSVFTMGTLLSILLSKFDSEDFYIALPVKYCIVIISVYYATAFTVLSCVQALNVESVFMNKDMWWLLFLLIVLGWYMTLIALDVSYFVFDYVYHFLCYSILYYKGNKHVM